MPTRRSSRACAARRFPASPRELRRLTLALLLVAGAAACDSTGPEQDARRLIIHGTVSDESGRGLSGAYVTASHYPIGCSGQRLSGDVGVARPTGEYVIDLRATGSTDGCVRVVFDASSFATDSAVLQNPGFGSLAAPDSVRLDMMLKQAPPPPVQRPRRTP